MDSIRMCQNPILTKEMTLYQILTANACARNEKRAEACFKNPSEIGSLGKYLGGREASLQIVDDIKKCSKILINHSDYNEFINFNTNPIHTLILEEVHLSYDFNLCQYRQLISDNSKNDVYIGFSVSDRGFKLSFEVLVPKIKGLVPLFQKDSFDTLITLVQKRLKNEILR